LRYSVLISAQDTRLEQVTAVLEDTTNLFHNGGVPQHLRHVLDHHDLRPDLSYGPHKVPEQPIPRIVEINIPTIVQSKAAKRSLSQPAETLAGRTAGQNVHSPHTHAAEQASEVLDLADIFGEHRRWHVCHVRHRRDRVLLEACDNAHPFDRVEAEAHPSSAAEHIDHCDVCVPIELLLEPSVRIWDNRIEPDE